MKGQNKQDKICLIHSSKETGVRNVTHPSPSNSTMWPGAAQPRTETPEAGAPAVPGFPVRVFSWFCEGVGGRWREEGRLRWAFLPVLPQGHLCQMAGRPHTNWVSGASSRRHRHLLEESDEKARRAVGGQVPRGRDHTHTNVSTLTHHPTPLTQRDHTHT